MYLPGAPLISSVRVLTRSADGATKSLGELLGVLPTGSLESCVDVGDGAAVGVVELAADTWPEPAHPAIAARNTTAATLSLPDLLILGPLFRIGTV